MTETKSNSALNWLFLLISVAAFAAMLIFNPAWFWVTIPFVCTFFVKALNLL